MPHLQKIAKSAFYEVTCVLDDFAKLDDYTRLEQISPNEKTPERLPHHQCLYKVRHILYGIISSISFMQLSILHIQRRNNKQYFSQYDYRELSVFKYHYYVFIHAVSTLRELHFKLVIELCDIKNCAKKSKWKNIQSHLNKHGEVDIIRLLECLFASNKHLEDKRNIASHEGLLAISELEHFHLTDVYANFKNFLKNRPLSSPAKYTEGTKENTNLLQKTKKLFISDLNAFIDKSTDDTLRMFELLLPKLLNKMDKTFIRNHWQDFSNLNMKSVNDYILQIDNIQGDTDI